MTTIYYHEETGIRVNLVTQDGGLRKWLEITGLTKRYQIHFAHFASIDKFIQELHSILFYMDCADGIQSVYDFLESFRHDEIYVLN
jgi:hypothetical protein